MLLLVLISAFVFLYQGRQALQTQYETTRAALEQKQAESELRLTNSEGTRTAAEQSLIQQTAVVATTEQNMLKLVQESAQSQQTVEALQFETTRLATDLGNLSATRAATRRRAAARAGTSPRRWGTAAGRGRTSPDCYTTTARARRARLPR